MDTSRPRRTGVSLATIGALIVLICFFLPWVRACNMSMTGWELATNKYGNVEEAPTFFVSPAAALICLGIGLYALVKSRIPGRVVSVVRIVAAAVGSYPLLVILVNVIESRPIELLVGFWGTALGLAGMFVGSLMDAIAPRAIPPRFFPGETVACPQCGANNPVDSLFCRECGVALSGATAELSPPSLLIVADADKPCPRCQTVNTSDTQFCHECGAALAPAAQS